ncbi:hypothetical protein [Acinetobacter nosocomialis]|uniref:hypothetical protein n=1 Tax=Acinetobacter nosocomialis TaxID=106654 RepID=UPI00054C1814|nr:hypothetical protein [Acinetobacter nosocomialis]
MDNYKLIIKSEDLFKLFFNKVPYIWSELDSSLKNDETYQPNCLYKESVRVVEAFDKFVDDVKSGSVPQVTQLQINITEHAEFDGVFLPYFKKLEFNRRIFDLTCLKLGLNWTYFQKFLEEDAVKLPSNTPGIEKILLNSSGSSEWRLQWSPSKFPHKKIYRLNNFFLDLQKDPLYIEKKDKQVRQVTDKINDAFKHFDYLLSIHQEVYILALDIRFVRIANQAENKPLEQLIEQVLKDRAEIQNTIFTLIPDRLRTYIKLEHDYQKGLKLSCILILRRLNTDPEEVSAHLQASLKKRFSHYDAIEVSNGNRFVRTHGNKSAVGRMGINTPNQVEQFKYWVLSYFFKIDSVAKLIHPQITLEVNEVFDDLNWKQPDIHYPPVPSKKIPQPKNLAQVLQEWKASKSIWDVKHLDKRVADRLLVEQIYYKEFCAEQGLPELYGEWLFHIEVFIETLLHNQYPAFNEVRSANQMHFLNVKDIQTSATQLGQQYWSLVRQFAYDLSFVERIDYLINRGLRTWRFGQEGNSMLWRDFHQNFIGFIFDQPIPFTALDQLNINLQKLQLHFFTTQALEIDKREILEKQYTQCARRQADTRKYLDHVLEQNCWAYRISVKACSSNGSLEQSEFSKLFTEFMRLAKQAKPCYWLRGYIGIWQEKNKLVMPEFTLDVVLFFNDRCQEQLFTVVQDLNQRWNKFLDAKAVQTLKLQNAENIKYFGSIEPKVLMRSVDGLNTAYKAQNTYHVCIEASDRKMKKMVIEHVIPYFVYRDVFQAPFSQKVPKVFIKGAIPKK